MTLIATDGFIGQTYTEVTIASGILEISQMVHTVKSESGVTDDLTQVTINAAAQAALGSGRWFLFVLRAKSGHTITVKHGSSIKTTDGLDYACTETKPVLMLYDALSSISECIGAVTTPGTTLVDLNSGQTLTNKNLTAPIITSPELTEKVTTYASGAISTNYGVALLTAGSPTTYTLADPTAGADDGQILRIMSTTAQAHKVDNSAGSGFNVGGAGADTLTFGGAIGDCATLLAYNGDWYVLDLRNVTITAS